MNHLLDEVSLLPISLMKIKNSAGPNAVPCDTTEMTCIQDKPIRDDNALSKIREERS